MVSRQGREKPRGFFGFEAAGKLSLEVGMESRVPRVSALEKPGAQA